MSDNTAGKLVTVERNQEFVLWVVARDSNDTYHIIGTKRWKIDSIFDVANKTFNPTNFNFNTQEPQLSTIINQQVVANELGNLKIVVA